MAREINYYQVWLGIDAASPNHYELLGLEPNEANAEVIKSAAAAALSRLKNSPTAGPDEIRRRIAREIKTAYSVLSNQLTRRNYDAWLATNTPSRGKQATTPVLIEASGFRSADPREPEDLAKIHVHAPRTRRSRKLSTPWTWLVIVLIFVVGPAIPILFILFSTPPSRSPYASGDRPTTENVQARSTDNNGKMAETAEQEVSSVTFPKTSLDDSGETAPQTPPANSENAATNANEDVLMARDNDKPTEQPADHADPARLYDLRFRMTLASNRLASLEFASARQALEPLELADGAPFHSPVQLLRDWADLVADVELFWLEVEHHAEQLRAAREFTLLNFTASVVGVEPAHLLFRWRGQTLIERWDRLPSSVTFGLLESVGIRDWPTWRRAKAAFLIASRPLQEATKTDINRDLQQCDADGMDVDYLFRLLNEPLVQEWSLAYSHKPMHDTEFTHVLLEVLASPVGQPPRPSHGEYERTLEIARKSQAMEERRDALIRAVRLAIASQSWSRCQEAVSLLALEHSFHHRAVLLECARQIARYGDLNSREAARLVDELIHLSGRDWADHPRDDVSHSFLELARELALQHQLRLQLNRLELP